MYYESRIAKRLKVTKTGEYPRGISPECSGDAPAFIDHFNAEYLHPAPVSF